MDFSKVREFAAEALVEAYFHWGTRCGLILWLDKPSAPKPPDYVGAAKETGRSSVDSAVANALLNRADQFTPWGSQTWEQTGSTHIPGVGGTTMTGTPGTPGMPAVAGHWQSVPSTVAGAPPTMKFVGGSPGTAGTAGSPSGVGDGGYDIPRFASKITLSPDQQKLFDSQTQRQIGLSGVADTSLGHVKDALATPFSTGDAMPEFNQNVADALYNRSARYLDPQWSNAEETERNRLANSGFSQQDEGFGKAYGTFADAKDRAYATARDTAVATGGDVGLRQRQQDISERLLARSQPLSEYQALTTGSAPQMPQFPSTNVGANAQGANLLGAAQATGQSQNDIFNSEAGTYNSNIGALGGLGSSALMYYLLAGSDERIKTDIRRVGETDEGLPVYIFRYKGLPQFHMGVMAQDVEKVHPELVFEFDGIKAVNYGGIR